MPSRTSLQFQAQRSCSSSRTMAPSTRDARIEAGRVEAHQREQGMYRRDVADTLVGQHPRQPAGLVAQVAAYRHIGMGGVAALTEQEVDDREHRVQPSAKLGGGRRLEIDVQVAQPISGPLDAFLDVGLGGEQAAGDLGRAESAERPEREGDAGFRRHGFMAADEQEAERLVADLVGEMRFGRRRFPLGLIRQVRQRPGVGLLPPPGVDREIAGGAVEPAGRVFGNAARDQVSRACTSAACTTSSTRSSRRTPSDRVSTATSRPNSWRKKCSTRARGSFMRSRPIGGSRSRCRPDTPERSPPLHRSCRPG